MVWTDDLTEPGPFCAVQCVVVWCVVYGSVVERESERKRERRVKTKLE